MSSLASSPPLTTEQAVTAGALLAPAGRRALGVQGVLLVLAAFVLPALGHAAGVSSSVLLPMHWPVLMAGLAYGARRGAVIGAAAPLAAFALSGMPPVTVLPAMIAELATYGVVAGRPRAPGVRATLLSLALALVAGRAVFVTIMAVQVGHVDAPLASLAGGAWTALAQLVALPFLARWWIARERGR